MRIERAVVPELMSPRSVGQPKPPLALSTIDDFCSDLSISFRLDRYLESGDGMGNEATVIQRVIKA